MGNFRPLPTKCWEKFLSLHGFIYKRTAASHDQWTKRGFRTIPVQGNEKQVPAFHMKNGCEIIGCTLDDLYTWAENNC
jgi:hypothetical protein